MRTLKIGLITTLNTNIGDDFIRDGICQLLRYVFQGRQIEFIYINKHRPMTAYPKWHPCHWVEWIPRGRMKIYPIMGKLFYKYGFSHFDDCDLIVQCGAPVLWPGCSKCEWAEPLWHQIVGRLYERSPVLNLAAGSCYAWEKQPAQILNPLDAQYLKEILGYCRLTTVRDILAHKLFSSIDSNVLHLACSALLAGKKYISNRKEKGLVLINYMDAGGHFDFDQGIDSTLWHGTIKDLINRMEKRHNLVFLCHNQKEYDLANKLDSTLPRIWPKTTREYFILVAKAQVGLFNRMHASVALSGLGIPSIAVGTDTRLLMVAALGLPSYYVKDVDVEQLEWELEYLLSIRSQENERLAVLQSETWEKYSSVITDALRGSF